MNEPGAPYWRQVKHSQDTWPPADDGEGVFLIAHWNGKRWRTREGNDPDIGDYWMPWTEREVTLETLPQPTAANPISVYFDFWGIRCQATFDGSGRYSPEQWLRDVYNKFGLHDPEIVLPNGVSIPIDTHDL